MAAEHGLPTQILKHQRVDVSYQPGSWPVTSMTSLWVGWIKLQSNWIGILCTCVFLDDGGSIFCRQWWWCHTTSERLPRFILLYANSYIPDNLALILWWQESTSIFLVVWIRWPIPETALVSNQHPFACKITSYRQNRTKWHMSFLSACIVASAISSLRTHQENEMLCVSTKSQVEWGSQNKLCERHL